MRNNFNPPSAAAICEYAVGNLSYREMIKGPIRLHAGRSLRRDATQSQTWVLCNICRGINKVCF